VEKMMAEIAELKQWMQIDKQNYESELEKLRRVQAEQQFIMVDT
jgi:hypothetical protein